METSRWTFQAKKGAEDRARSKVCPREGRRMEVARSRERRA